MGACPGVSATQWTEGLTEGHGCIRLTIEDGGPNDDDGLKNGVIRDPGTLAVRTEVTDPDQAINVKSGGSFNPLLALLIAALALLRQRKLWLC